MTCSRDTNGDGNCGRRGCPECAPLAPDRATGLVAGEMLPTSLADFIQAAAVQLEEEQRMASPDNARIGFLCNAVRLAREHARRFPGLLDPHPIREALVNAPEPIRLGTHRESQLFHQRYAIWFDNARRAALGKK